MTTHRSFFAALFCGVLAIAGCVGSASQAGTGEKVAPSAAATAGVPEPLSIGVANESHPLEGVITGGAPTAEQLASAQKNGLRSVVSLLPDTEAGATEEAKAAAALGLRYVSIPIAGPADLNEDNARKLGDVLRDPGNKPLLLHCGGGNRAGALLSLELFYVEGYEPKAALEIGKRAGLKSLEPAVRAKLAIEEPAAVPAPAP